MHAGIENRQSTDPRVILEKLARIPIQTWNYISDGPGIRHIGPMAQDFYGAFGVGDDRHIYTVDAAGVAFGAIKGLYELLQEQRAETERLRQQLQQLESDNEKLQSEVAALESSHASA